MNEIKKTYILGRKECVRLDEPNPKGLWYFYADSRLSFSCESCELSHLLIMESFSREEQDNMIVLEPGYLGFPS